MPSAAAEYSSLAAGAQAMDTTALRVRVARRRR
jgi:hypothetical protein